MAILWRFGSAKTGGRGACDQLTNFRFPVLHSLDALNEITLSERGNFDIADRTRWIPSESEVMVGWTALCA